MKLDEGEIVDSVVVFLKMAGQLLSLENAVMSLRVTQKAGSFF
jgi:hypothetical protein